MNLFITVVLLAAVGFLGMPVLKAIFKVSSKLLWFAIQGIIVIVLGFMIYKFGFVGVVLMILSVPFLLYGVGYILGWVGTGIFTKLKNKRELGSASSTTERFENEDDDFDFTYIYD